MSASAIIRTRHLLFWMLRLSTGITFFLSERFGFQPDPPSFLFFITFPYITITSEMISSTIIYQNPQNFHLSTTHSKIKHQKKKNTHDLSYRLRQIVQSVQYPRSEADCSSLFNSTVLLLLTTARPAASFVTIQLTRLALANSRAASVEGDAWSMAFLQTLHSHGKVCLPNFVL